MTFDLGALADRFRRATERPIVPPPTAPPPAPAPVEQPWLTAEAFLPAKPAPEAPGGGPPATGPSPPAASHSGPTPPGSTVPPGPAARLAPEGPTSRHRPRRRRWLPPSSPGERTAEPVDPPAARYRCPACGKHHQPLQLESGGLFAPYRRALDPWGTDRPEPFGREAGDTTSLARSGFRPWRIPSTGEPPGPSALSLRERIAGLWHGDV